MACSGAFSPIHLSIQALGILLQPGVGVWQIHLLQRQKEPIVAGRRDRHL